MTQNSIGWREARDRKERDEHNRLIRAKQLVKAADHELGNIIAEREQKRKSAVEI